MTSREDIPAADRNEPTGFSRPLALVSSITLLLAALFSAWRFLAAQSPSSPIHLGPLFGPVSTLCLVCWIAGFGGLALSVFVPRLDESPARRRAVALVIAGWGIILAALIVGAILGTNGVQVIKAYPRTVTVVLMKLVGFISLVAGLAQLLAAVLRRGSPGR